MADRGWVLDPFGFLIVISYLLAFQAGEPVLLVLPWAGVPGEPALEDIQRRVLECTKAAGRERFPDLALVDRPENLDELLAGCATVTPVPRGRGAVAGLVGAYGLRLAAARSRLAQGPASATG